MGLGLPRRRAVRYAVRADHPPPARPRAGYARADGADDRRGGECRHGGRPDRGTLILLSNQEPGPLLCGEPVPWIPTLRSVPRSHCGRLYLALTVISRSSLGKVSRTRFLNRTSCGTLLEWSWRPIG